MTDNTSNRFPARGVGLKTTGYRNDMTGFLTSSAYVEMLRNMPLFTFANPSARPSPISNLAPHDIETPAMRARREGRAWPRPDGCSGSARSQSE